MGWNYILFDLDGTLTDPEEGITRCAQFALESMGIREERKNLRRFIGPPLRQSFMEYYGLSGEQADRAVEKYRERFATVGLFENRVLPGIPELLDRLRRGGRTLAVATSKPTVFTLRILEKFGLAPYFRAIVGSELSGARTQKAEVIREALKRLDLGEEELSRVVMVGDRLHDVEGARACGVASIGVRFGYAEPGELERHGADHIAATVEELGRILGV